jgi:hypothetical protein
MKFGKIRINASVIIAILAALYILMVCREKYFIEYAEGEPAPEEAAPKEAAPAVTDDIVTIPKTTPSVTEEIVTTEGASKVSGEIGTTGEEGMSAMAIAGIAMGSIFGLILIVFVLRTIRLSRYR